MIAEGLDTTGNDSDSNTILNETLVLDPPVITDIPDSEPQNPVTPIPSPALLPGLIGMGAAAIRKRNRIVTDQA